jgi:hypothetical protein
MFWASFRVADMVSCKFGGFPPFPQLGTASATLSGMAGGWSAGRFRRKKMTFNLTSLQQLAVSLVGAVFAASLFVSAAVGPVGQFI